LNFTLKANIFGPQTSNGIISTVNANIGIPESVTPQRIFTATGDTTTAVVTSQSWQNEI